MHTLADGVWWGSSALSAIERRNVLLYNRNAHVRKRRPNLLAPALHGHPIKSA